MDIRRIFEEAVQTSDKRKKVLNELITVTKQKVIPAFMDSCKGFGLKHVYFKFNTQVLIDSTVYDGYEYEKFYTFGLDITNNKVFEPEYKFDGADFYYDADNCIMMDIDDAKLTRTGITTLVKALVQRLETYNKKYAKQIREAEELISDIDK